MTPDPPLWQHLGQSTYGNLRRDPAGLVLTVSDLDDHELALELGPADARALAVALLADVPRV
jgi:hypothetical protein